MKWLEEPGCWVFDDGRVAVPSKQGLRYPKQTPDKDGYLRIRIGRSTFRVHRLVAVAFIPNTDNTPTVDHINRIRYDNRLENLRWATPTEQAENSVRVLNSVMKYGFRKKEDPKEYHRLQMQEYRKRTHQEYNQYQREYKKLHYAAKKAALRPDPASSQEP